MPVALDAVFSSAGNAYANSAGTISGMTVGSGASALLVGILIENSGGFDFSTTISAVWDSVTRQTMTLLGNYYDSNTDGQILFYGLVNPVSGAKALLISGTSGYPCVISALSFKGANSVLTSAAFKHFNAVVGSSSVTPPSIAVTSATGNMVAGFFFSNYAVGFTLNPTVWFSEIDTNGSAAASYTAGAASATLGGSISSQFASWVAVGIDIVALPIATMTAVSYVDGHPAFGVAAFSSKQVFTSVNYANSAPTLGVPAFSLIVPMPAAVNYADSSPTFGAPTPGFSSVFVASNYAVGRPAFDTPTLNVISWFTAINYADSAPAFDVPTMVITGRTLFANNLAVSSPFFSGIAIGSLTAPGLTSLNIMTASPQIAKPSLVIPPKVFTAVNFITTSPQLGSSFCFPIIHMFASAVSSGNPILGTSACDEIGPPMVWLLQRLKNWSNDPNAEFYDEDGTENEGPVQQAIFSNMNDDIELSVSPGTLVGRSAPDWGPAEIIQPVYPLVLQNNKLQFDLSNLNYLDDAAAAAGGVPIGGIYRNGNVLMVRVT